MRTFQDDKYIHMTTSQWDGQGYMLPKTSVNHRISLLPCHIFWENTESTRALMHETSVTTKTVAISTFVSARPFSHNLM